MLLWEADISSVNKKRPYRNVKSFFILKEFINCLESKILKRYVYSVNYSNVSKTPLS